MILLRTDIEIFGEGEISIILSMGTNMRFASNPPLRHNIRQIIRTNLNPFRSFPMQVFRLEHLVHAKLIRAYNHGLWIKFDMFFSIHIPF